MISSLKKNGFVHVLLAFTFIVAGFCVNGLQICTMILWWLGAKDMYRTMNIKLAYSHWAMIPFLSEWWADVKVNLYMTKEDYAKVQKENAIVILNHKYDIDWLAGWVIADRVQILGNAKCMAKKALSYLPLMGWSWRFCEYIFVRRKLEDDVKTVLPDLQNLGQFKHPFWMLIFCEGTRFTLSKHKSSIEYAKSKGVVPLKHHLLPRSGGFNMVVKGLRSCASAVYDCTMCVPKGEPTLVDLLHGKSYEVQFLCRRISLDQVPEDDIESSKFLHQLYKEKDENFEYCLKNGNFPIGEKGPEYLKNVVSCADICQRRTQCLWITLIWLVVVLGSLFYYFLSLLLIGSWWKMMIITSIILAGSILFQQMLAQADVKKSSSTYGSKNK